MPLRLNTALALFVFALGVCASAGCGSRHRAAARRAPTERPVHVPQVYRPERAAPAAAQPTTFVRDLRLRESGVTVIWGHFEPGVVTVEMIAAPGRSADWVTVVMSKPSGLHRCDELVLRHGTSYSSAPLDTFDRAGVEVRFEVPLSSLLQASVSAQVSFEACEINWVLTEAYLGEFRRFVLNTLMRRAQVAPGEPVPSAYAGTATPPWRNAETSASRAFRGRLPIGAGEYLDLVYDVSGEDVLQLETRASEDRADYEACEILFEVGPAAVRADRVSADARHMTHTLHRMDSFVSIGLVDEANLMLCDRRIELRNSLSAIRRFALILLAARAEAGRGVFGSSLPAAPESDDAPSTLPQNRSGSSADTVHSL